MTDASNITGIVLAGGKSTRMGEDKGFVSFNKKPFIFYSIDALKPLVGKILIVSDHKQYEALGYQCINDIYQEAGPLSGLYSGLKASKTELNIVLSCDVPLITSEIVLKLLKSYKKNDDAVVCKVKHRLMPLVALYTKNCEAICLELLQKNERKMMQLLKTLKQVRNLHLHELEATQLKNINNPTELNEIKYGH
ncbi:MAG: hypothetical protein CMC07_06645 [Flavobacteriaceae bacterium]|nr:hypothetical protein [Flavobacteriaceae bacterium]|tara:strand:+ start:27743 stop:28324 length:582 start_codon:yes stop_codon:yes gene_type:complete